MKTFILPVLLFLAFQSYGQDYDSLKQVIQELTLKQNTIDLNLQKAHEQYSTGTVLIGIGAGVAAIGAILHFSASDPSPIGPILMTAGGVSASTGWVIQLDSHKWLGRRR